MNIPQEIIIGDSISWLDNPGRDNLGNEIAPPDYTLIYAIRGTAAGASLDLTATEEDGSWKTTIAVGVSDDLPEGDYGWQAYAVDDPDDPTEKITLGSGRVTFKAALRDKDEGYDSRSQARKDLAAVQTAIRAIISGGAVAEYTVGNRSLRKIPLEDLIMLESKLKSEVASEEKAEKIANGLGNPSNIYVRFR